MKKKIITCLLFLTLFFPLISNSIKTVINESHAENPEVFTSIIPPASPFIYGSYSTPNALDPVDCWDYPLLIIIDQVAETLFTYNFSDPSLPLIPLLATGYDMEPTEKLNFTIYLRQGVIFHDGSEFNSTVAKWNFDRMEYWWNFSGLLPSALGGAQTIFYWEDGKLPIWNRTEIVDAFTIKFILNKLHVGFIHLLTCAASAMLSMESTPFYSKLTLGTDQIIGTGPFVFDHYILNSETKFHAFENYWREKANIEILLYQYFPDQWTLNTETLAGNVHFIDRPVIDLLDTFKANTSFTTIDNGNSSSRIGYITFNYNTLDNTFRKALSYAINYTDIIERILDETSVRLKSPLPPGMLYSNTTFDYPYFNITKARLFMQSIGHGATLDPNYPGLNETQWEALADTGTYNFSMWDHTTVQYYHDLFDSCKANFRRIGINIYKKVANLYTLSQNLEQDPNWLDIWPLTWLADYNDPSNYINFLLSNGSSPVASGNLNDPYLQNLMGLGLGEFNPVLREGIYDEIQRYVVEELMPKAWLYVPKMYHVHNVNLTGFSQNYLERLHFYDYKWRDSYSMSIISSGDISFIKGSTGNNITWTITAGARTNPIYEIYVDNIFNTTGNWQNNTPLVVDLDDLPVGTYEYKIEVYNTYKTAENIVNVEVIPFIFDISQPSDISYTEGDTGNTISWVITSNLITNPTYNITRNNTEIDSNPWSSGVPIVINVDGLSVGSYEYKIEARNSDNVKEDIVIVTVEAKEVPPWIPGYPLLFILGITIITMTYIFKKSKKKD